MAHPAEPEDARADVSADSALILAALGRLETAVRDERAVLGRLRRSLADMAQAIARAKAVADSETSALLLDEFEHRIDGMIEIAGGPSQPIEATAPSMPPSATVPAADFAPQDDALAEIPAEHDQVPTVSDVVSRLGPNTAGTDHDTPPADETAPPVESDGHDAPSVAMLTAMVEALRDSISTNAPDTTPDAPQEHEPAPVEAVDLALDLTPAIPPVEIASVEEEQLAEPEPLIALLGAVQPVEPVAADMEIAEVAMEPESAAAPECAPDESQETAPAPVEAVDLAQGVPQDSALALPPIEIATVEEEQPAEPEPLIALLDAVQPAAEPTAAAMEIAEVAMEPEAAAALEIAPDESQETAPLETATVDQQAAELGPLIALLNAFQPVAEPTAAAMEPVAAAALDAVDIARAVPDQAHLHERSLLASFEQMGVRPFPPPEEGTAVIFTRRAVTEFTPTFAAALSPEEPAVAVERPTPAASEATPVEAMLAAPLAEAVTPEAIAAEAPEALAVEPPAEIVPTSEPAAAEAEFDPADFLFEPEPEPATSLLDLPALRTEDMLPQTEFVAAPPEPAAHAPQHDAQVEAQVEAQIDVQADVQHEAETTLHDAHTETHMPEPHDPLHALKAMSENERIALFT